MLSQMVSFPISLQLFFFLLLLLLPSMAAANSTDVCADADADATPSEGSALAASLLPGVSFWVEGVAQSAVAAVGIAANFVSAFVLTRPKMRNAFNLMLVALAAFDSW